MVLVVLYQLYLSPYLTFRTYTECELEDCGPTRDVEILPLKFRPSCPPVKLYHQGLELASLRFGNRNSAISVPIPRVSGSKTEIPPSKSLPRESLFWKQKLCHQDLKHSSLWYHSRDPVTQTPQHPTGKDDLSEQMEVSQLNNMIV
ncbi:hypothetical protein AVEN_207591-1 [Araneus ventricosus]|uniref:Uncharacterized protein n=1 Tax=Araneus ventricosus TaxID=182803 RepID=A0A4Y2R9J0_ARAVE|nr:hypothetical protein AVEN_207591-1 [Araneus ventricosus]